MEVKPKKEKVPWSIRRATLEDYDEIVRAWTAGGLPFRAGARDSREGFRRQLERFGDLYLVATVGTRLVGVVFGSHDERKGWINRVVVIPEYRRRGLASVLVNECDAAIRAHGIEIVAALVETSNISSRKMFERLGYVDDVPVCYYRKLSHKDA